MTLSEKEKASLVSLTLEIINADYKITDNEMRFYSLMQKDFSLTECDFNNGRSMDPYLALDVLKNMSDDKKTAIGLVLRKLISIDGQPHDYAIDALNEITIKADLLRAMKREIEKVRK